jgi:hypothetical protein
MCSVLEKLSDPSFGHSSKLKTDAAAHHCKTSLLFTRQCGVIFSPVLLSNCSGFITTLREILNCDMLSS